MGLFWFMLPLLFAVPEAIPSGTSEPGQRHPSDHCHDWGIFLETVQVYDGEAGILKCPLFSEKGRYNYSSAQAAGLTLVWYWIRDGQDLEKPIDFRLQRISKLKERLWFQPAVLNDTGNYICMLRNSTYCFKVMVPLIVLQKDPGTCINARFKSVMKTAPIEKIVELVCPDFEDFLPTPHSYTVNWYYNCVNNFGPAGFTDREVKGNKVIIYIMREAYAGNYTCVVNYTVNGKPATLTRTITVKVVGRDHKELPMIHNPNENEENIVTLGEDLDLTCRVQFYYMEDSDSEVWWSLNGKKVEPYTNTRFRIISSTTENLEYNIIVKTLRIEKFNSGDLKGDFTCFARNALGEKSSKAIVKPKAYVPSVELGCGLGFILFLMIVLIVVYHVYWLELVLLYRAHFGTDESLADGKEYDIYISYARNTEEEEFVLLTLREVLENDLGYKVCIFDRDSLPGGNVTEAVLTFIQKSRRLIVILSPDYLTEKSISLLECRLGLLCQHTDNTRIITVLYKPVGFPSPEALQLKRHTLIKWKGTKSKNPRSKFWKFLRLAIPLRTLASGVRLIDSTSSHSDINVDVRQVKKASPDPYQTRPASKPGPGSSSGGKRFRRRENGCTACKACVSYSEKKPGSAAQGGTAWPVWETRLCKSRTCGAESNWIHSRPTAVSKATLTHGRQLGRSHTHHCCCDISNNNDLCAL